MALTWMQINDEIEVNLPIEARRSWRLWHFRTPPFADLRVHRKMYPASHLRIWWAIAASINVACVLILFVRSFSRSR